jgi:hypothetical protein
MPRLDAMSYEEVKHLSAKYIIPCKVIYELHSEFNCILELGEVKEKEK